MRVNYQQVVPNMNRSIISELMQVATDQFITLPFAFLKNFKRIVFWGRGRECQWHDPESIATCEN